MWFFIPWRTIVDWSFTKSPIWLCRKCANRINWRFLSTCCRSRWLCSMRSPAWSSVLHCGFCGPASDTGRKRPESEAHLVCLQLVSTHGEFLRPLHARRSLHHDEERENCADGDRQPGVAIEEKCIGKQHEVHELRETRFRRREFHAHHQAQVTHQQKNRNAGTDDERQMDGDVIHQIGHEQMKREERASHEKIIHGVKVNALHRGEHKNDEEEK